MPDDLRSPPDAMRIALIGLGEMGAVWVASILQRRDVELVGIVASRPSVARDRAEGLECFAPVVETLEELARLVEIDAVVNATPPAVHHATTAAALARGFDVLSEKPLAQNLTESISLVAHAEIAGKLLMVSQSRRYHPALFDLKRRSRELGDIGFLTTDFFRAPRFGNFRDRMAHPLLIEMAIHPFDSARFLLDSDPVAVQCDEFNPGWSWYEGAACVSAFFEMATGARYVFNGSWCSEGLETSWNSSWRLSGQRGTALWDGDNAPVLEAGLGDSSGPATVHSDQTVPEYERHRGIDGALTEFVQALASGGIPYGEAHANLMSVAMVEAAIVSAEEHRRVAIEECLQEALDAAIAAERSDAVRMRLQSWTLSGIPYTSQVSASAVS